MRVYEEFHGDIRGKDIGSELRRIVFEVKKTKEKMFKILTGYGSTSGKSVSKNAALKSLKRMKSEGIINGYLPGEVKSQLLNETSPFYDDKLKYANIIKNDKDYGNDGIIFIFL